MRARDRATSRRGLLAIGGSCSSARRRRRRRRPHRPAPPPVRPVRLPGQPRPACSTGWGSTSTLSARSARWSLIFVAYVFVVSLSRPAIGPRRAGGHRAAQPARAGRPAAGVDRHLQLSGVRPHGGPVRRSTRTRTGLTRSPSTPLFPVRRVQVVVHPQRLRPGLHGVQLPHGAVLGRGQRLCLQVDRRGLVPRARRVGLALRPPARQGPGPRRRRSSGSTRLSSSTASAAGTTTC